MATLYVITGPDSVGKSTVSMTLAKLKRKSVLIDGDDIYHQVIGGYVPPYEKGNHLDLFWTVAINLIGTYLEAEYTVIFNYMLEPEDLYTIKMCFGTRDIKFVVLMCDQATLISRDKQKAAKNQMNERCTELLNKFKSYNYGKDFFLDTTHTSVLDVIQAIENSDAFNATN